VPAVSSRSFFAILLCLLAAKQLLATEEMKPGLVRELFVAKFPLKQIPVMASHIEPTEKRVDHEINFGPTDHFPGSQFHEHFSIRWSGTIKIPRKATYTFFLESDDGSQLLIDGHPIIDNDGEHPMQTNETKIELSAGNHSVQLTYFQNQGQLACKLLWQSDGIAREIVPEAVLFHESEDAGDRSPSLAASRIRQYSSRLWQSDSGLPHNSVQTILQTRDGYLWIGTRLGLARFDGVRFRVLDEIPELKKQSITALCETKEGLWIGTEKGLVRWNSEKFQSYDQTNGLAGNSVTAICEGKDGSAWIGTRSGLTQWKNGKFTNFSEKGGIKVIRSICEDKQGTLWLATSDGLHQLKEGIVTLPYTPPVLEKEVRVVRLDQAGNLWVGSNNGLFRKSERGFDRFYENVGSISGNIISALHADRSGQFWIGTYSGLHRLVDGKFRPEKNSDGTVFDQVNAIFEDREENIWIGTKEGLTRLKARPFTAITAQQGLIHNNVMSVLEDKNGVFWSGTWGGGLNKLSGGKITAYTVESGLVNDLILSVCKRRDGSLWFGADFDGGLYRLQEGTLSRYGTNDGLAQAAVRTICEDRQGNLWIGTSQSLYFFRDGKFTHYTTTNGLAGVPVRVICEGPDGALWIGTDAGLNRFHEGRFTAYTQQHGLSDNKILSLHFDHDNMLWIGTGNGGLNRFHGGKFTSYTTAQGLRSDEIFEILEDDDGFLWMSCLNGIFRVGKKSLDDFDRGKITSIPCTSYGKTDGMVSLQCNGVSKPAGWKARDGRLWFATTKGLVVADPKVKANETPPPVVIEEVMADKREVLGFRFQVSGNGQHLKPETETLGTLSIPPSHGELEFHYTALSFQDPEKNRFKYKLEGVDREWVDAGGRRVAYYNNLDPGRYEFRVMACNNDGLWNSSGATVALALQPHYAQTWWFKFSLALGSLSLAAAGARLVTRKRMQRKLERLEQQHAIEKERIRIAQDMHDDLGARLTEILMLTDLTRQKKSQPDEVESQTLKTTTAARDLIRNLDALVWAVNPRNDSLDNLATYFCQYADKFLSNTRIRCRLDVPLNLPHAPFSSEARHNSFLVLKEALNNAVKHSGATEIWLRIKITGSQLQISLEDDGKGFSAEEIRRFGNGLANMRRRVEDIGGKFAITSRTGAGTHVQLQIPISAEGMRQHLDQLPE
jgi:ligand-binding sensor domain-containing protein/signal transduction histidine kinase